MAAPNQFTTTRWTLVLAAKKRHDPAGSEAFARLCERYYQPMYSYLRRRGETPENAQDLMQGFMARLIEKDVLRHAEPARGRFRAFLLTSLKHYAANEYARATAARRGGVKTAVSLDLEIAEGRYRHELRDDLAPPSACTIGVGRLQFWSARSTRFARSFARAVAKPSSMRFAAR
jgi:DNA-directed RNA polymerase specialized sigma24 family protein